jgi:hypothetical protein
VFVFEISVLSEPYRCCSLRLQDDSFRGNESQWDEFFGKMKDAIVASFESTVGNYEEEIRKSLSKRLDVGWDFYHFFLLKVRRDDSSFLTRI